MKSPLMENSKILRISCLIASYEGCIIKEYTRGHKFYVENEDIREQFLEYDIKLDGFSLNNEFSPSIERYNKSIVQLVQIPAIIVVK